MVDIQQNATKNIYILQEPKNVLTQIFRLVMANEVSKTIQSLWDLQSIRQQVTKHMSMAPSVERFGPA